MKLRNIFYWILYLIFYLYIISICNQVSLHLSLILHPGSTQSLPMLCQSTQLSGLTPLSLMSVSWPYLIYPNSCSLPEIPSLPLSISLSLHRRAKMKSQNLPKEPNSYFRIFISKLPGWIPPRMRLLCLLIRQNWNFRELGNCIKTGQGCSRIRCLSFQW